MTKTSEVKREFGRRVELLGSAIMRSHRYTFVDIAAGGEPGASLIQHWQGTLVAPDGLMVRTMPLLVEFKGKTVSNVSRGGAPGTDWMRAGTPFHAIERANFAAYHSTSARLGMPLVVLLICIEDAVMVGASLDELGEPYVSLAPELYDVVDFPLDRFSVLMRFNKQRLKRYFSEPLERLTEARLRRFVLWLRDKNQQGSFDFVNFMTFDNADQRWVRRSA